MLNQGGGQDIIALAKAGLTDSICKKASLLSFPFMYKLPLVLLDQQE